MKRSIIFSILCSGTLLFGCGGGDEVRVEVEPAGENCTAGGLKITVNGDSQYACESEPSEFEVGRVPAGAEGNPCPGEAIRVTNAGSHSYVCSEITEHPIPAFAEMRDFASSYFEVMAVRECACVEDDEDRAECEAESQAELRLQELFLDYVLQCSATVFTLAGPPPDGERFDAQIACLRRENEASLACYTIADEAIEGADEPVEDACGVEWEDAFDDCMNEAEAAFDEDCGEILDAEPSVEEEAWSQSVMFLSQFENCPVEFLMYGLDRRI